MTRVCVEDMIYWESSPFSPPHTKAFVLFPVRLRAPPSPSLHCPRIILQSRVHIPPSIANGIMGNNRDLLQATFNHVAFPPRLPNGRDGLMDKVEEDLIKRVLDAIDDLHVASDDAVQQVWHSLQRSLEICQAVHDGGQLTGHRS